MQRALVTTAAAIIVTALAVSTAGCGGSAAAGAPPTVHAPASDRPAAVTQARAKQAEVYVQVLRRYLSTPAENSFPAQTFKTVYVLNQAYTDAADPNGTHGPGAPIAPQTQRQVTAALAGMAHVIFIADRGSVIEARGGCEQVRNGGIVITLGPPAGHGNEVRVAINGFVACLGATWLTYVLRDQPDAGWRVTGTTGSMAIALRPHAVRASRRDHATRSRRSGSPGGIRRGCPSHVAGTTWMWHPRRMGLDGRGTGRTGGAGVTEDRSGACAVARWAVPGLCAGRRLIGPVAGLRRPSTSPANKVSNAVTGNVCPVPATRDESCGVRRSYCRTRYRGGLLMRSVTYSMGVSLDGYIVGPDGGFDWTAPDEEVFRFATDEIRQVGVHLLGRRLYQTMLYWETADQDPSLDDAMLEWAALWKPLPKVVFSTTLPAVQGHARLASGGLAEEIEQLRAEPAEGDIAIGGATLAAEAAALGLIDEYRARVYPVLVGGGSPFFPQRERRVDLELVETRTFSSRVVYLRYRVTR